MTQKYLADIRGPVTITISGPQGSGKTRLAAAILAGLEAGGIEAVAYGPEVPAGERRWRKPYSTKTARAMLVEGQSDVNADLVKALKAVTAYAEARADLDVDDYSPEGKAALAAAHAALAKAEQVP